MSLAAVFAVLAGFVGLGILVALTLGAYRQSRSLGSTVVRAGDAIAAASEARPPLERESAEGAQANVW